MRNICNSIALNLGLEQDIGSVSGILKELGMGETVVSIMDRHGLRKEGVGGTDTDLIVVYVEGLVEFWVFVLGVLGFEEGAVLRNLNQFVFEGGGDVIVRSLLISLSVLI